MAQIPQYQRWLNATALGASQPRSLSLRKVDSALQEYEKNAANAALKRKNLSDLRLALNAWIREKGPNWRKSERNKEPDFPITALFEAVNAQPVFSAQDIEAFRHQDIMRRLRIKQIFAGKKIVWRVANAPAEMKSALDLLKSAKNGPPGTDYDAIRKIKEQHQKDASKRAEYNAGKYTAMREFVNTPGSAALDINSLRKHGAGASAGEHNFGLVGAGDAPAAFHHMMSNMFGGASPHEIATHLFNTVGTDTVKIAESVLPIVSNITSGAKMLLAWGSAALARYREWSTSTHSHAIAEGDMREAFKALALLLDRQTTAATIQATIQTADFATRTAMSFVDFGAASGTLVSAVSTLSKFVHKLYLVGREYGETRHARRLLSDPGKLDFSLFSAYPLMGCYMLVCSDLSELIVMTRDEAMKNGVSFGSDGWMDDVEVMKKDHIDPILEAAARLIYKSPFLMPHMPVHALYKPGKVDAASQNASKLNLLKNVGKAVVAGVKG